MLKIGRNTIRHIKLKVIFFNKCWVDAVLALLVLKLLTADVQVSVLDYKRLIKQTIQFILNTIPICFSETTTLHNVTPQNDCK